MYTFIIYNIIYKSKNIMCTLILQISVLVKYGQ